MGGRAPASPGPCCALGTLALALALALTLSLTSTCISMPLLLAEDCAVARLRVVGEGVPCLCLRVCPCLCLRVRLCVSACVCVV